MNWAELPTRLRVYISTLAVCGIVVSAWAIWDLISNPPQNNGWIVLAMLVSLTVPFSLFLESVSTVVGIGDAYAMAIAMIYGVSPCIVATFAQTFIISLIGQRTRRHNYRIVFNTASTVCAAWLYGNIYHLLNKGSFHLQDVVLPAAVLAITYFAVNSILTSVAIAWSIRENVVKYWANSCMPLAVDYSISALCATALVGLNGLNSLYSLAAAPVMFALWEWNKYHQARHLQTEKHLEEQEELYMRTVESLALAVDAKDQTTYGHIRRVRVYATALAKLCGIKDTNELKAIETGALLHDIGKIAIDDYILNKPGRLTKEEFEKIKIHSTAGDEILQQVRFPYPVAKFVRSHHERWDGLGYPDGLKGEEIPLGARILAISDAFDAIRFSRPYKLPIAKDEAAEILHNQSGTVYDPKLVEIFTSHIDQLEEAALRESENAPQLSFRKGTDTPESGITGIPYPSTPRDIPKELVQISEICSTMSGHLPLSDMLPILAQRFKSLVPFSTCAFFICSGNNEIAAIHVSGNCSEVLQGRKIEIGKGISGWVAAHLRPIFNTGPALDFVGLTGDFSSLADALVVPITREDDCLGTISLYAEKPVSYKEEDLRIIQTIANLIAPIFSDAVRNALPDSHDIHDPVTGLYRVSYLTAIGPQLISAAGESRAPISLIYIELKNLPQIVRNFGSNLADAVLKKIADSIKPELRQSDILVGYGTQGFVVFLPGVSEEHAFRCVRRLKQQIKGDAVSPGQNFFIDCQMGASFYPRDGSTILSLLQSAQENLRSGALQKASLETNVIDFYRA